MMKIIFAGLPKTAPADIKGQWEEIRGVVHDQYDMVFVQDGGTFPDYTESQVLIALPDFPSDSLRVMVKEAQKRGVRVLFVHLGGGNGEYLSVPMSRIDKSLPQLPYVLAVQQLVMFLRQIE